MMPLEPEGDRDQDGDGCEIAEYDPLHEWEPAIQGKTFWKHDTEQHQRRRHGARQAHVERHIQRLQESLSPEHALHAAAAADKDRKAQQDDQEQPRGRIADPHGSHPEAQRNTDGGQHDDPQCEINVGRAASRARGGGIGSQRDRELFDRCVALVLHLGLHAQTIAHSRVAQRVVIREEAIDWMAIHGKHGVGELQAFSCGFRLHGRRAPVPIAELKWLADILVGVPHRVEAIERVACEVCDRDHKQNGEAHVGQRVRTDVGLGTGHINRSAERLPDRRAPPATRGRHRLMRRQPPGAPRRQAWSVDRLEKGRREARWPRALPLPPTEGR